MKRLNVQALNECLGIDGPIWIEDNPDNYTQGVPCQPPTAFKKGHQTNKGRLTSELQKEIARKNAIERNKKYKGGENPRAKTWRITYNDGRVEIVKALQPWRIKNGYNKLALRKLQLNEWKRYKNLVTVEEVAQDSTLTE
jgi:hypothetical protein